MAETKTPKAPCLKYFAQATSDFPSLRRAIRSLGLEPLHIEVVRGRYAFSEDTLIVKIETSLQHLPMYYRYAIKDSEGFDEDVWAIARSRVSYTPKKHLIFPIAKCPDKMPSHLTALHLDLQTCEWSVGRGLIPEQTSTI